MPDVVFFVWNHPMEKWSILVLQLKSARNLVSESVLLDF